MPPSLNTYEVCHYGKAPERASANSLPVAGMVGVAVSTGGRRESAAGAGLTCIAWYDEIRQSTCVEPPHDDGLRLLAGSVRGRGSVPAWRMYRDNTDEPLGRMRANDAGASARCNDARAVHDHPLA